MNQEERPGLGEPRRADYRWWEGEVVERGGIMINCASMRLVRMCCAWRIAMDYLRVSSVAQAGHLTILSRFLTHSTMFVMQISFLARIC